MSLLYETIISGLGSRYSCNFLPRQKKIKISPFGRFYDKEINFNLGIKVEDQIRILPFSNQYNSFEYLEQEISTLGITFYFREPSYGLSGSFQFISPFYPEDIMLSTAPFFYINAKIEYHGTTNMVGDALFSNSNKKQINGEFFLEVEDNCFIEHEVSSNGFSKKMKFTIDKSEAEDKWLHRTRGSVYSSATYEGWIGFYSFEPDQSIEHNKITIPFVVETNQEFSVQMINACYTTEKALNIEDKLYSFKYTDFFDSIDMIITYAHIRKSEIMEKVNFFEQIFMDTTVDKSALNLLAFSFQSYLSNTWWMINDEREEWFTVWEGNCAYHSTIDVEYNAAMFYFMLWPQLMEKTIRQWAPYEKPQGYMSHDIGKFLVGKGMEYSHDMEVEENCDFIILNYALFKISGYKSVVIEHYSLLKRLLIYVSRCDTTNNGFPNEGTANTIDDANTATQFAKEQTYLGVKALSAFIAMKEIGAEVNDIELVKICNDFIYKIKNTMEAQAWLSDHYAVCLSKEMEGIKDAWTGEELEGKLEGWDAYSIYTTNGLLYLLMAGSAIFLDKEMLIEDIKQATLYSMTKYGCKHSSSETSGKLWISQNIWKDMIASYLGVDMSSFMSKYWDYEIYENTQGRGGCFVDGVPHANLNYYPRGVASIGLFYAMAGISIDKINKKIAFSPCKIPCKIPLFNFIDWETRVVPWAEFTIYKGDVKYKFYNTEQLKKENYEICVYKNKIDY